jgi:predicted TIM-barrel fold metal-dependent hydrolase
MTTTDDPLIIVSSDAHIGPRASELRPFCPSSLLAEFDESMAATTAAWQDVLDGFEGRATDDFTRNHGTAGHHDGAARRADMDLDGVAAEVIFHGSQNGQAIPFNGFSDVASGGRHRSEQSLAAEGLRIYNRWLASLVSEAPQRHVGLAHLPMWDPGLAAEEAAAAADEGLRGINFPAPRPDLVPYNDDAWEPLWRVCAERGLPLATHAGSGGTTTEYSGSEAEALQALEHGGWFARRALHWMVLGGVFERHPQLRLVLAEQPGLWWSATLVELDSVHEMQRHVLRDRVPRRPSEYCSENVLIGASFLARFEVEAAIDGGYVDRVMWGSDYPHMEGTFQHLPENDGESIGRIALRSTFAGVDEGSVRAMAGENAARLFGLDLEQLRAVAAAAGAPSHRDLGDTPPARPAVAGLLAFRSIGPWA